MYSKTLQWSFHILKDYTNQPKKKEAPWHVQFNVPCSANITHLRNGSSNWALSDACTVYMYKKTHGNGSFSCFRSFLLLAACAGCAVRNARVLYHLVVFKIE